MYYFHRSGQGDITVGDYAVQRSCLGVEPMLCGAVRPELADEHQATEYDNLGLREPEKYLVVPERPCPTLMGHAVPNLGLNAWGVFG